MSMTKSEYQKIGPPEIRAIEEASELIQAICKAKRFGLTNFHPNTPHICNADLIIMEWNDLNVAFKELLPHLIRNAQTFSKERGRLAHGDNSKGKSKRKNSARD